MITFRRTWLVKSVNLISAVWWYYDSSGESLHFFFGSRLATLVDENAVTLVTRVLQKYSYISIQDRKACDASPLFDLYVWLDVPWLWPPANSSTLPYSREASMIFCKFRSMIWVRVNGRDVPLFCPDASGRGAPILSDCIFCSICMKSIEGEQLGFGLCTSSMKGHCIPRRSSLAGCYSPVW